MSMEALTWVDQQDTGNAQSQLILQAVARHADWETGSCFPSVARLMKMAKCSDKTVRRHLKRLVGDRLLAVRKRHRHDGGQSANELTLVGYDVWVRALREGGVVAAPRRVKRYADLEESGQGPRLQGDQSGHPEPQQNGGGHNDRPLGEPLVEETTAPGRVVSIPPGHKLTTQEHFTELSIEPSPPTPTIVSEESAGGRVCNSEKVQDRTDLIRGNAAPNQNLAPAKALHLKFGAGWDADAQAALAVLASTDEGQRLVTALFAPVVGTLSPPKRANGASYVAQAADRLSGYSATTLQAVARRMLDERKYDLPAVPDLVAAANRAALARSALPTSVEVPEAVAAEPMDAKLAAGWAVVCRGLMEAISVPTFNSWFGRAVPRLGEDRLTIQVPDRFHKKWILEFYADQLGAAVRQVWSVTDIDLVIAGAAL